MLTDNLSKDCLEMKPMKSYMTANKGFIYIRVSSADAVELKLIDNNCLLDFDPEKEVHLTTDGAWDLYYEKRLEEPSLVRIYKTQQKLSRDLEKLGFRLY